MTDPRTLPLLEDPDFRADLLNSALTDRAIADRWGIARSSANKWRRRLEDESPEDVASPTSADAEVSTDASGGEFKNVKSDKPITDWRPIFEKFDLDPDEFEVVGDTVRMSMWQQSKRLENGNRDTINLYSYSARFRRKTLSSVDLQAAGKFIEDFVYVPSPRDFLTDAAVLMPTDEQFGKVDFDGGTPEAEERILASYSAFADYAREFKPRQILLAHGGDGIENSCSVSSQRDTNDLSLPDMLVQMFKIELKALTMIAPLAPELVSAYIPSNHGRWRVGMKEDAGNPHADFGMAVGKQIQTALEGFGTLPNVRVGFPAPFMESMTVQLDTVRVGLVHGHQVSSPDKLGDWWAAQDHGRMPTWDADVLLVGHFHSFRALQSGDRRWLFVGPASDGGSSWFSNLKGERASSGMLALAFEGKRWRDLALL